MMPSYRYKFYKAKILTLMIISIHRDNTVNICYSSKVLSCCRSNFHKCKVLESRYNDS